MDQCFDIFPLAGHDRIDINAGQFVVSQFACKLLRERRVQHEGAIRGEEAASSGGGYSQSLIATRDKGAYS